MVLALKHISSLVKEGSGIICLNGAAARLVQPGDTVIIISYALVSEDKLAEHTPKVAIMDEENRIIELIDKELEKTIL